MARQRPGGEEPGWRRVAVGEAGGEPGGAVAGRGSLQPAHGGATAGRRLGVERLVRRDRAPERPGGREPAGPAARVQQVRVVEGRGATPTGVRLAQAVDGDRREGGEPEPSDQVRGGVDLGQASGGGAEGEVTRLVGAVQPAAHRRGGAARRLERREDHAPVTDHIERRRGAGEGAVHAVPGGAGVGVERGALGEGVEGLGDRPGRVREAEHGVQGLRLVPGEDAHAPARDVRGGQERRQADALVGRVDRAPDGVAEVRRVGGSGARVVREAWPALDERADRRLRTTPGGAVEQRAGERRAFLGVRRGVEGGEDRRVANPPAGPA